MCIRDRIITRLIDKDADHTLCKDIPLVILMIGINGGGKTTSIGKIAYKLKNEGKTVMLAAADTFRAAAAEQLCICLLYTSVYRCKARGIFKQRDIKTAVGDKVVIEVIPDNDDSLIVDMLPRKNSFIRPFVANVDCLIIVAAAARPSPAPIVRSV